MRIKIAKLRNEYLLTEVYTISIKTSGSKKVGKMKIDYPKERIEVNLGDTLKYKEKLQLLKEIFYKFAYSPVKLYSQKDVETLYFVEQFKFVDVNDEESVKNAITVIEELLEYPCDMFKEQKRKERLISAICNSNKIIEEKRKNGEKVFELQPLWYINRAETEIYKQILYNCLKDKKHEFMLNDVSSKYNSLAWGYGYYNYIRVFEYFEK